MWVHRSGELYKERPIVIYEYQKGRDHHIPLEFYKDYKGVLVTDGLSQYHLVDKKLPDVTNANCWAHARRNYADAIKIIRMFRLIIRPQSVPSERFVWARRTGCSITQQMVRTPVHWFTVFRKPQS